MRNYFFVVVCLLVSIAFPPLTYSAPSTQRIQQFANDKVRVWRTVIYPGTHQALNMHRHEHPRILVALSDGVLKVTNNEGKSHYLHLKKDRTYYFSPDVQNELHNDQNMSSHPIKVLVIELL